jgi:hypothetical protein
MACCHPCPHGQISPGVRSRPGLRTFSFIGRNRTGDAPRPDRAISSKQANPNGTPGSRGFTCSSPAYQVEQVKKRGRGSSDPLARTTMFGPAQGGYDSRSEDEAEHGDQDVRADEGNEPHRHAHPSGKVVVSQSLAVWQGDHELPLAIAAGERLEVDGAGGRRARRKRPRAVCRPRREPRDPSDGWSPPAAP